MYNLKLDQIIGQEKVKEQLKISIKAARIEKRCLPHILFIGSYGYGKTTLAKAVAAEMNTEFVETAGPALDKIKDVLPFLAKIQPNSILFIDEIHRIRPKIQEFLYSCIENFFFTLGRNDQAVCINLPQFTLIGATAMGGRLEKPFYDRFRLKLELTDYEKTELTKIVQLHAEHMQMNITPDVAAEIAKRSKNTPRLIVNYLTLARDYSVGKGAALNGANLRSVFELAGVDEEGMTAQDRKYMDYVKKNGPVGLAAIASYMNLDKDSVEQNLEPWFISTGRIFRSRQGRWAISKDAVSGDDLKDLIAEFSDQGF